MLRKAVPSSADIVVVIDQWPWPTVSGIQRRSLAVIDAVQELGLSVAVAALVPPDKHGVDGLREYGLQNSLAIYPGHWVDAQAGRARYWLERVTRKGLPFTTPGFVPSGARRWRDRV